MRLISTLTLASLILVLAGCSKSPAPSTSFIASKYLGIDHLYTCKGLEQDSGRYVIRGDESGSTNTMKMSLVSVTKANYLMGPTTDNELVYLVDRNAYSSRPRGASGSLEINRIDSTIFNIHGNFYAHLINVYDSTDYLDVSGEVNVKYKY